MRPLVRALSCNLVALVLLWPSSASATTIDWMTFEELVLGADFVGIVECDRAGGVVAGYSVLESWKGPRAGTHITIRVAVNYWEPQFPITLCGERYFVTAFKQAPFPWRESHTATCGIGCSFCSRTQLMQAAPHGRRKL